MKLRFTPRTTENIRVVSNFFVDPKSGRRCSRASRHLSVSAKPASVSQVGRRQETEGVQKVVTKRYSYLIYYTHDVAHDEIVVLNVKHPAQEREHSDL